MTNRPDTLSAEQGNRIDSWGRKSCVRKPCSDCPFVKSSELAGSPDWLKDLLFHYKQNPFFKHSCHKTDPRADGYVGGQQSLECAGNVQMILNALDKKPGRGGVYESHDQLIETYLAHWLGNQEFEEMRKDRKNAARLMEAISKECGSHD